jgi:hypothetical protein
MLRWRDEDQDDAVRLARGATTARWELKQQGWKQQDIAAAISGITPDGRLFMQTPQHAYSLPDAVRFVRVLLRKIAGKLLAM